MYTCTSSVFLWKEFAQSQLLNANGGVSKHEFKVISITYSGSKGQCIISMYKSHWGKSKDRPLSATIHSKVYHSIFPFVN